MENTAITQAQKLIERMAVSMAIQEVINHRAIMPTQEQKVLLDAMIVELAQNIKPAEA
tara:strand:+ start:59 stop:232 length:174 start_codon:yes stop_codon:yes gene_type:complete